MPYNLQTKRKGRLIIAATFFLVSFSFLTLAFTADAAQMKNYCVTPPYIGGSIQPNLMLMIDNSASMFDLSYTDPANYCYDNTYQSTKTYVGYFKNSVYYSLYSGASGTYYFAETNTFPTSCPAGASPAQITNPSNQLFVCYDPSYSSTDSTARTVVSFVALGNYLNWLTMSKFDIEKQILTGGNYSAGYLKAESRGCVGQMFIKQPLTKDYVAGGTNTPLGITFGINGPTDPYNTSAPSPGGQTHINVFVGAYNQGACQAAINDFSSTTDVTKAQMESDIGECIGFTSSSGKTCATSGASCSGDADCYAKNTDGTAITGVCGAGGGACSTLNQTSGATCSKSNSGGISGICTAQTGACSTGQTCIGGTNAGATCSHNNDCNSNNCSKTCTNSMMLGVACSNDNACNASKCTQGNTLLSSCSSNAACDIMTCAGTGTSLERQTCTDVNSCKYGTCTSGKSSSTHCVGDSDCYLGAGCTTGSTDKLGKACTTGTDCVDYNGPCQHVAQLGSTYGQTMHTCYQLLFKGQTLSQGDFSYIDGNNSCNTLYKNTFTCLGGPRDGLPCASSTDTSCGTGTCINGPAAIRPGSPVLVCGLDYAGYCASSTDNWNTTNWNAMQYAAADGCACDKNGNNCNCCIGQAIVAYCNAAQIPNVTDPTDNASSTSSSGNLPAILGGTSLQGQLGASLYPNIPVAVARTDAPTGLIQQYSNVIRMGAMTFNTFGSPTECTSTYPPQQNQISCPMICSTDPTITCGSKLDCPSPASAKCLTVSDYKLQGFPSTCYYAGTNQQVSPVTSCTSDTNCDLGQVCMPNNKDGSQVIYYIGYGKCYDSLTHTPVAGVHPCATDAGCSTDQYCKSDDIVSDGVGGHTSGLVSSIDRIKGASWTPFAEGFYNAIGYFAKDPSDTSGKTSRSDIRINSGDYNVDYNPSQKICQSNNLLLITDGMSTADQNASVKTLATTYSSQSSLYNTTGLCPSYSGSTFLENLSWVAYNRDIVNLSLSTASTSTVPLKPYNKVKTFVVYNSGGASSSGVGDCNSQTLLTKTANNSGTNLLLASDSTGLYTAIESAFNQISAQAASGTAASVLASGEGSGANLIQAIFYPTKKFYNSVTQNYDEIGWTGRLTNLWYYVDPDFGQSSIHEDDGVLSGSSKVFDLKTTDTRHDYTVKMYFDEASETARAKRWEDTDGNAVPDGLPLEANGIPIEDINHLWEAGTLLWKRAASTRIISANTGTSTATLTSFTTANAGVFAPWLDTTTAEATNVINWVRGTDIKTCSNATSSICTSDADCTGGTCGYNKYRSRTVKIESLGDTTARVWKLGDILSSTPKISSWMPLRTHNKVYGDSTYGVPYQDSALGDAADDSHFTTTTAYKNRGMVYVGGNDGMLHAFKLGNLQLKWGGQQRTEIARLSGTGLGEEQWAFIPRNVLPYLKYISDTGYCHLYSVDLTPVITDASVGPTDNVDESGLARSAASWRTILIGGMRYGGACKDMNVACTGGGSDCVKTPASNNGYSAYFALDITDQSSTPKLLWEFSHEDLGFSTSGPAIVRIKAPAGGAVPPNEANGKWFVVLASGPTGSITTNRKFTGSSDQNLNLFVLDLKTGSLMRQITTPIPNAFAGNIMGTTVDTDLDYQDDVVYIPYVKKAADTWTSGGVGRLVTKEDPDPAQWVFSKVIDDVGPVTATVSKLLDPASHKLWLMFGTGRYFFEASGETGDDSYGQRHLIGLKDECFSSSGFDDPCPTPLTLSSAGMADVTTIPAGTTPTEPTKGWYIRLEGHGSYTHSPDVSPRVYDAERSITDSTSSTLGVTFFTTFKPYDDACSLSGRTFFWAVKYNTGGPVGDTLSGTMVIQLSTGQIAQVNLAGAFNDKDNRRAAMTDPGAPPGPGGGLISPRSAVNKTVHIKER